ncbi:MAG: regulatory protein RecX [Clostridia bacterium]|nr:regulatory protein RecX [Clostridia bacterium]
MQITAIVKQKNGSYDIYVDGEKVEKLDALVLAANRNIKVGAEISSNTLEDIKKTSGANFAFDAGIKYISRNMHTESEVREKLLTLGYSPDDTESAIDRLKDYGYVSDEAYCKAYVATYGRNRGKIRLSFELANKGIDKEIISQNLPEDDRISAKIMAESKIKKYTDREKMIRYLMGRGYEYDVAREVASEVLEDVVRD